MKHREITIRTVQGKHKFTHERNALDRIAELLEARINFSVEFVEA